MLKKNSLFSTCLFLLLSFVLCILCGSCLSKKKTNQKQEKIEIIDLAKLAQKRKFEFKTKVLELDETEYKQIFSGEPGKHGGIFIKSLIGTGPKTFNYWTSNDSTSSSIAGLMYVGLVTRDPWTGKIVPDLAKDFKIKKQGKQVLVYLRKNLKWSDGKLITADDVLFTWNKIVKQGFEILGTVDSVSFDGKFPKITKINDYLVSFETKKTFAPLLSSLSYPIAPAHYFERKLNPKNKTKDLSLEQQRKIFTSLLGTGTDPGEFVVSGAFKIRKYLPGQRIEFERNPNYFTFDQLGKRLPYFDKLIIVILPSSDLEIFKFSSGELSFLDLELDTLKVLKKINSRNKFKVYRLGISQSTVFFVFNLSKNSPVEQYKKNWFRNLYFRESLALAIDREQIINTVYQGRAVPLCLFFNPQSIYYDHRFAEKSCNLKPDLKKARDLLKKINFKLDSKNLLRDPENNQVKFSVFTNAGDQSSNSPREAMAILLKEQWAKLGIELDFKTIEFNNLVQRVSASGDWETIIIGLSGGDLFEPNSSKNVLKSDSRLHMFNQRNQAFSGEKILDWEIEIDRLLDQGVSSFDYQKRKVYYSKIQKIMYEQKPMLFLVAPEKLVAVSKNRLGNFQPSQLAGLTWNLEQLYFID